MLLLSYPSRHGGVDPLFELGVCGEAVPHDVRGVVFVSQLWAALKQEVYDKEFDAPIHAWNRGRGGKNQVDDIPPIYHNTGLPSDLKIGSTRRCSQVHLNQSHKPLRNGKGSFVCVCLTYHEAHEFVRQQAGADESHHQADVEFPGALRLHPHKQADQGKQTQTSVKSALAKYSDAILCPHFFIFSNTSAILPKRFWKERISRT